MHVYMFNAAGKILLLRGRKRRQLRKILKKNSVAAAASNRFWATLVEATGPGLLANNLWRAGFSIETRTKAVELGNDSVPVFGNDSVPVFGSQLKGYYIDKHGRRTAHFAVPGWYRIIAVDGNSITICSKHPLADTFSCGIEGLKFVLGANLELVEKGLQP
jgi:hypothetical protein